LALYRGYDSGAGRWLNRDPIEEEGGLNLYGYVANNPLAFIDPLGLQSYELTPPNAWWDPKTRELTNSPEYQDGFKQGMGMGAAGMLLGAGGALAFLEGGPAGLAYYIATLIDIACSSGNSGDQSQTGVGAVTRKPTTSLRKEWEEIHGEPWPVDPRTGRPQDAHHKNPLADGGEDHGRNIEPKPRIDHVTHHKENGDFRRWGARPRR
jgi:uncharacterized protein RhaS with RHS repeats